MSFIVRNCDSHSNLELHDERIHLELVRGRCIFVGDIPKHVEGEVVDDEAKVFPTVLAIGCEEFFQVDLDLLEIGVEFLRLDGNS